MKVITILTILSLTICSCKNDKTLGINNDNLKKTTVEIQGIDSWKIGKYSDFFDSINFVKLETNPESIIGRIDKVLSYKGKYFILDQVQRKAVLAFDTKGNYLGTIGKIGKGPGEYAEPNDIAIDRHSDQIAVWCNTSQKILFYDLNGVFMKSLKLKHYIKSFKFLGKHNIAIYLDVDLNLDNNSPNLIVIDRKGNEIYSAFNGEGMNGPDRGGFDFLSQTDDKGVTLLPGYSNNIFTITDKVIANKFEIDFNFNNIPKSLLAKSKTEFKKELRKSNYAFVNNHFVFPDYLIFNFVYKKMIYSSIFSTKSSKLFYANLWQNNINGLLTGSGMFYPGNENEVISVYDPSNIEYLKEIINKPDFSGDLNQSTYQAFKDMKIDKELLNRLKAQIYSTKYDILENDIEFVNSINSTDNPVLIIKHLKS